MSLNLPATGYYPQQFEMGHPPSGWVNGYIPADMYPMPMGMMPIYPNTGKKIVQCETFKTTEPSYFQ